MIVQDDCWRLFVAIDSSSWPSTLMAFAAMFWKPKPSYSACTHDLRSQASTRIPHVCCCIQTHPNAKRPSLLRCRLWCVPKHRQEGWMNILRAPMKTNDSETPAGLESPWMDTKVRSLELHQWFNVWLNMLEMGQVYSAIATTCSLWSIDHNSWLPTTTMNEKPT